MNPAIRKHLFWRESGGLGLASALHIPQDTPTFNLGVVICPPVGHEHVHAFRTFRRLADVLAAAGFPTIRFEYRGTGNSFGETSDCRVTNWVDDIEIQIDGLATDLGLNRIILIGFRFGAQLAALASRNRENVSLITWANVRPKAYVRELRALSRLSGYPQARKDGVECGGFVYSNALLDDIAGIDDRAPRDDSNRSTMDIKSGDSIFSNADYEGMLLEPHYTKLPEQTIRAIVATICSLDVSRNNTALSVPAEIRSRNSSVHAEIQEDLVWTDALPIAGVRCRRAENGEPSQSRIVIFSNAGSVHSMGPNRVYTSLARSLAEQGLDSFRFDLPNLGESTVLSAEHENEPYLDGAEAVIQDVIRFCRQTWGYDSVVVAGLCSGSYNGFLAACGSHGSDIAALVMINPLTFHWEPGMPFRLGSGAPAVAYEASHYARATLSRSSWARLLTGKVNYLAIIQFSMRRFWSFIRTIPVIALDFMNVARPTMLAARLNTVVGNGVRLVFVFSSRDPGLGLLREEARFTVRRLQRAGKLEISSIKDADHTFSQSDHRRQLQKEMVSLLCPSATENAQS